MKYIYIVTFKIDGISLPQGIDEVVINEANQTRVILCSECSTYSIHADRGLAMSTMILKGLTGQGTECEFEDRLNKQVALIQTSRNKKFPNGPFIVFEGNGETPVKLSSVTRDFGPLVITFDAVDKGKIKERYKKPINQYLTSLFLIAEKDYSVKKVFEGFYLKAKGKIYYSYTASAFGTVMMSNPFTEESAEKLKKYISALTKANSLEDVYRLLVRATSEHSDKLRSFIFAWTALEIFFNKIFKLYEVKFLEKHTIDGLPILAQHFFKRIKDVMKGKYSLRDKFIVIASMLSDDTEDDLDKFVKAKKMRDTFLHGEDIEESQLPIQETVGIVRKYLSLHLLGEKSQQRH